MLYQVLSLCADAGAEMWEDAQHVVELLYTHGIPMGEQAYIAQIKLCGAASKFEQGETLLREARSLEMKLGREVYSCILRPASAAGHLTIAQRVFELTQYPEELELEEEDFAALLLGCASMGDAATVYGLVLPTMAELIHCVGDPMLQALWAWCAEQGMAFMEVGIPATSTTCPHCALPLRSIDFSEEDRVSLLIELEAVACEKVQQSSAFRVFQEWVHRSGPFSFVIDGGSLDFTKVDRIAYHFLSQDKPVLLVLRARNFRPEERADQNLLKKWIEGRATLRVYETPRGMNDDLFWLYAGVWNVQFGEAFVISSEPDFRFKSPAMLRRFAAWRERHCVGVTFDQRGAPNFRFPPTHSLRMHAVSEAPYEMRWHFPLRNPPLAAQSGVPEGASPGDDGSSRRWLCCPIDSG